MLALLATAALRSLLLAVLVWLGLRLLRVRHPRLQLMAWTSVLAAALAMPALQHVSPLTVPAPFPTAFSVSYFAPIAATEAPPQASTAPRLATDVVAAQRMPAPAALPWRDGLTMAYVAVAWVLLLRLLFGLFLAWRLLRGATPIEAPWADGGKVRLSAAIRAPVTIGNSVLLPTDCIDWPAATGRAVLAHERAHVARGDFVVQVLSQLHRALFWFSPLSWWLHHRLVTLAELASDDDAIAALGDRPDYAEILLEIARHPGPVLRDGMPVGVAMARPATVGSRIERILSDTAVPVPVSRRRLAGFAAAIVPLALAVTASWAAQPVVAAAADPPGTLPIMQPAPHTAIKIDPALLDSYAGVYQDPKWPSSVLVIAHDGDHLLYHRAGSLGDPNVVYPYTATDFFATVLPLEEHFTVDAGGNVIGVVTNDRGVSRARVRLSDADGKALLDAVAQRLAAEQAPHTEIAIDPTLLDRYVGAYQFTKWSMFRITRDGNSLIARFGSQQAFQLHAYSNQDFFYTVVAAQISFVTGADGKATALVLHQNGFDRTATRVDDAAAASYDQKLANELAPHSKVAINPALLAGYVGTYANPDLQITATQQDGQLFVQVTGFRRYAVYPYDNSDFFATWGPAQISFVTDSSGRATSLVRHQWGIDEVFTRTN
jgi:beta-lactamase regulating signal transducer with metallopeptidase domain